MRKFLFALILTGLIGCFPNLCAGHNADQLPFLQINGKDAAIYPVGSTSLTNFVLPQDKAPEPYLVNMRLHIALETVNLPILAEYIPKTRFTWNFGDGTTAEGLAFDHTYTRTGSYVLSIYSTSLSSNAPAQLLDLVKIDIVPNLNYQLPQAVITVNDQRSTNAYTDILKANLHTPVYFNANFSTAAAGDGVKSYFWDFGDQKTSSKATDAHTYDSLFNYVLPVLRVTDNNGFFADALVQVQDNPSSTYTPTTPPTIKPGNNWRTTGLLIFGIIIFFGLALRWRLNSLKTRLQQIDKTELERPY